MLSESLAMPPFVDILMANWAPGAYHALVELLPVCAEIL